MLVQDILQSATEQLTSFVEDPVHEAQLLLSFVLKKPREKFLTWPKATYHKNIVRVFNALVEKRVKGAPMAYLVGEKAFWDITLYVNDAVLIPRPETELLVELALSSCFKGCSILELGTGSGAISCAIAKTRSDVFITATDKSQPALLVAMKNAERLGTSNITFCEGHWFCALPAQKFDMIISNPPYIVENDPHLSSGDLRCEPSMALISGRDGLDALREIITHARHYLKPGGKLLLEHGYDQAARVKDLLLLQGFCDITTHRDLAGHERVTAGSQGDYSPCVCHPRFRGDDNAWGRTKNYLVL